MVIVNNTCTDAPNTWLIMDKFARPNSFCSGPFSATLVPRNDASSCLATFLNRLAWTDLAHLGSGKKRLR